MHDPQMFALVDAGNENSIYAYGIDTGQEAFTFRRDPTTGKSIFSTHANASRAYLLFNRMISRHGIQLRLVEYKTYEDWPVEDDEND